MNIKGTGQRFCNLIDNRDLSFPKDTEIIKKLCDRRFGIGGDGLIYYRKCSRRRFLNRFQNGVFTIQDGNGLLCVEMVEDAL